jgi:Tfp pilus assembly protein PilO
VTAIGVSIAIVAVAALVWDGWRRYLMARVSQIEPLSSRVEELERDFREMSMRLR